MNECELMLAVCGAALCENVEGSFLCLCASDLEEYDAQEGRCRPRGAGGEPCVPPAQCTLPPTPPPRCLAYTVLPLLQLQGCDDPTGGSRSSNANWGEGAGSSD